MNTLEEKLNDYLSTLMDPVPVYTGTSAIVDPQNGSLDANAMPVIIIENVNYPEADKVFGQRMPRTLRIRYQIRCVSLQREEAGMLAEQVTDAMNTTALFTLTDGWVCINIEYSGAIPKITQVDRESGYAYTQAGPEYVFSLQKG